MFSCVWLHFKKFSGKYFLMFGKEEGKDKPKKNITNDHDPRSRSRRRDLAINGAISRSTRREIAPLIAISVEGEIAINCTISRRRDLTKARSRSTLHEIAPSIAISVEGEIAIKCAISRRRDLVKVRSQSTLREIALSIAIFAAIVGLELARSVPPGARSPPAIVGLTRMFLLLSRACALSLSLSLFQEML